MLGVGVIFGLLSPVSKALLDSGLISPAGLMMTRTAGAAAAFWTASLFVRREPVAVERHVVDSPDLARHTHRQPRALKRRSGRGRAAV